MNNNNSSAEKIPASIVTGYIYLLIGLFLIASNFIAGDYGRFIPPWQLAFLRFLVALLLLLPFSISTIRKNWKILMSHKRLLLVYGILGVTFPGGFAYTSLQQTTALNGAFIFSSSPIITLIIAGFFFHEKLNRLQILGIFITFVGVLIITCQGNPELLLNLKLNMGDVWMLGNALTWALYTVFIKHWRIPVDALSLLVSMITIGLIGMVPFCIYEILHHQLVEISLNSMFTILYIGIFISAAGYFFYISGVRCVGASKAGLLMYLMPVFAVIQAYFILGQKLEMYHFLAISLIGFGILLTILFDSARLKTRNISRYKN